MLDYNKIFLLNPFTQSQKEKKNWYFVNQKKLSKHHYKNCDNYKKVVDKIFKKINYTKTTEELPFLHASLFKKFNLKSINLNEISKSYNSSGTSGSKRSIINLDKKTSLLQSRALSIIMKDILKENDLDIFFIDTPNVTQGVESLTARGAAIRGFSQLVKNKFFLLDKNFKLKVNHLKKYIKDNPNKKFIIFGFTSYIWEFLINKLIQKKIKFPKNNGVLIHGGGWKKLEKKSVDRDFFNNSISKYLGLNRIHNYYGMIEQTGSIFLECENGYFHSSIFSEIFTRDENLKICKIKKPGLIQVLSLLPLSYPGHNILTEDIGTIFGEDDCKCGRSGKYFLVHGRAPGTETRGCSDVG